MGMNLDELEQERNDAPGRRSRNFRALWDHAAQEAKPLDVTKQVLGDQKFGAKDYIPNALPPAQERWTHCTKCSIARMAFNGAKCSCGGVRFVPADGLVDPRVTVIGPRHKEQADAVHLPAGCNAVSGYHEMCERGTVGCTEHRRAANRFFRCHINHAGTLCRCSQPVIVDWQMLENAENAAMFVLGILKGAKSSKLGPDDVAYLAHATTKIMAHWARKALGHKPEDEINATPAVQIPHSD